MSLPKHMKVERGLVKKTKTIVPRELTNYTLIENCAICGSRIKQVSNCVI